MSDAYDRLVIEVELPTFNADGMQAAADEFGCDLLDDLLDNIMRSEVGLTIITQPGEKEQNSDFEVVGMTAQIVGARIIPAAPQPPGGTE